MTPSISLTLLLFAVAPAIASQQVKRWTHNSACATDTGVSKLLQATQSSFDASAFCSDYIQPYSYINTVVITTVPGTTLAYTTRTTTSTTITKTNLAASTTTVLCPTPSASQICGISADGNYNNLITEYEPLDAQTCQQRCLASKACKSFQSVNDNGTPRCNLYDASAAGITFNDPSGASKFYDRGCPDVLPSGCVAPAPAVTTAPSLASAAAKERAIEKRYAYPSFLSLNGEYMVFICSCIITSAAPTSTAYETFVNYVYPQYTVTNVQTRTAVVTEHPNWSTVYSSIS